MSIDDEWGNRLHCTLLRSRDAWICDRVAGRSVLHLGCTDAPFTLDRLQKGEALHAALEDAASELVGVDIDAEGIKLLGQHCTRSELVLWNVEERAKPAALARQFDTIVCADMIEHVSNPGLMLENIRDLLAPGGELIITTINGLSAKLVARAMFRKEAVHTDHVAYYSFAMLKHLCKRYRYEVADEHFMYLYPWKSRLLTFVQGPFYAAFPATGDGVAVVARAC
jgi:2-polyprenyl-3-methyl-5-hydroxy-6-metoxy-1,4-benzoquinol methylase